MKSLQAQLPEVTVDSKVIAFPEPAIACQVCGDIGYVYAEVAFDNPLHGQLMDCPAVCQAVLDRRRGNAERLVRHLETRIKSRSNYDNVYLDDYGAMISQHQATAKQLAYSLACQFVEALAIEHQGRVRPSLMLFGDYGTGKTLLASCIHNELWRRGIVSWCMTLRQAMDRIKDTFGYQKGTGALTEHDVLTALKDVPVLIWDEMDMHKVSEFVMDKVEDVLDDRYRNQMPTVMTTNLQRAAFASRWGERTESRVSAMAHWIPVGGLNLRELE